MIERFANTICLYAGGVFMSDYKKTLNLPETKFPMKANLVQREPEMLKAWDRNDAYSAMLATSGSKGFYTLHDGPPYANGHIHLGTALNKVLKDIVIKARNMQGWQAPYVPGWDCHGLPIEHKVEQELGEKKKTMPQHAVRKACRKYAEKYVDIQRKEFRRLGGLGEWEHPYLTMTPDYEAVTAATLADFVEKGGVVRSKKPIYWCTSCQTALAEAEVEYGDETSPSVYVRFPLPDARLRDIFPDADPAKAYVVIWTTTPWTLPANLAVALHPEFDYALVEADGEQYLLAEELLETCAGRFGWKDPSVIGRAKGAAFEGLKARHPFYDRDSVIVLGEHVTLDAGTGAVHTAPGHGREDYDMGVKYGLDIYSPLDDEGRYLPEVKFFAGMQVFEANPLVIAKLKETGSLLAEAGLSHSYPHCWRCKQPVIFRATTQWFITMDANELRRKTLEAIRNDVRWIPAWGEERIYNMIEQRPDWCISRQRLWGVPILALLCEDCNEAWNDPAWMRDIASRFATHPTGCDYWYETDISQIVPQGLTCPRCGGSHWKKETDILDVWFDSGTSFAAVVEQRPECRYPADLYLEGSDQHRGWFHSSLLISMATRGRPPYDAVLTHGYVVDGNGYKMSKSVGNVIAPDEIINKYGAEILRLWVSSVEYREDVRISNEILSRLVDAYRRIRNTCRYLLGNLADLAAGDLVPFEAMDPLDRYALDVTARVHARVCEAYREYEFHKVYHALHNLCVTDLSAFYLDVIKDRLYASAPADPGRRSAQTAMLHILMLLVRDMAPILSFTAEEVFSYVPAELRPPLSTVFALQDVDAAEFQLDQAARADWEALLAVRADVIRAIEPLRREGVVGHSLDTRVTVYAGPDTQALFERVGTDLRAVGIVSQLAVKPLEEAPADAVRGEVADIAVSVAKAGGEKCERCWIYTEEAGTDPAYPTLCPRCTEVMRRLDADGSPA